MENWMHILNSYNIPVETKEDTEIPIIIPKLKTFPQPMYNLPNDKQLVDQLLNYENKKVPYIPWQIIEMFRDMPFKWLSKVSNLFSGNDRDVLIIEDIDEVPKTIREYVSKFYTKYYGTAGFGYNIYPKRCGVVNIEVGLEDFLINKELSKEPFSRYNEVNWHIGDQSAYLFDGITIENLYLLYFKSGLSKECIFRFLKSDEFAYSIDHQAIEKEVERILNKH